MHVHVQTHTHTHIHTQLLVTELCAQNMGHAMGMRHSKTQVFTQDYWGVWCEVSKANSIDPCEHKLIQHCFGHGMCLYNNMSRYRCYCEPGWTALSNCKLPIVHICFTKPCHGGGTCVEGPFSEYHCECPASMCVYVCVVSIGTCTVHDVHCIYVCYIE